MISLKYLKKNHYILSRDYFDLNFESLTKSLFKID
jgi:hypothetical protein